MAVCRPEHKTPDSLRFLDAIRAECGGGVVWIRFMVAGGRAVLGPRGVSGAGA